MDMKKVAMGAAGGAAIGLLTGTFASASIHKALVNKIERLDEEFENTLSPHQLTLKTNLERFVLDADITRVGSNEHRILLMKVEKAKIEFTHTLRVAQLEIYRELENSLNLYRSKFKTTNAILTLLGGLAGGVIVAKLSK